MTKDGGGTVDIKKRTALAYASFNKLNKIWRARSISRTTKATLFKTLVLSALLYGYETWKMTKGEEKKLDIFQTKCVRRIFRIRWEQHVTNKEVLGITGADPISEEVRRKRWCWIGHVQSNEVNNDCAVALLLMSWSCAINPPTRQPANPPTRQPANQPTNLLTNQPTNQPSNQPTN